MQQLLVLVVLALLDTSAGAQQWQGHTEAKLEGSLRAPVARKHSSWPGKKNDHHKSSSPVLPQDGRVVIVLRGQSFRLRHLRRIKKLQPIWQSCVDNELVVARQMAATTSLVNHIVAPLENAGNKVDLVLTDGDCSLRRKLRGVLGDNRTVTEAIYDSPSQVEGIRFTLETLKNSSRSPETYDLILLTRHDIIWKKSIDTWEGTDFSNFNFLSRCEESAKRWAKGLCANDIFHMMPGRLFNAFDSQVGKGSCFTLQEKHGFERHDGHECYHQVLDAVGRARGNVGFVMDWIPKVSIQDSNSFYSFVSDR